jgi:HAD superfamily hydrolase (TIGR01450 family)
MTGSITAIAGLSALADAHDALICDIWGVVHNGVTPFSGACDALSRFRAQGGFVLLVSNAPRPHGSVRAQLDLLGVPREAYDDVLTSGDMARAHIIAQGRAPLHHIGPPKDLPLFAGLDAPRVPLTDAAYVVCTGLFDDERETAEDYRPTLSEMAARGLTMLCANPDLVVDRGGELIPCAGAIAALYETMGGPVIQSGKPHAPIYEAALGRIGSWLAGKGGSLDRRRVLAVGDAIRTDIAGAVSAGIPSLFVVEGIHAEEIAGHAMAADGPESADVSPDISDAAVNWLARQSCPPDHVIAALRW